MRALSTFRLRLPALGSGIPGCTLADWVKQPGERVLADEVFVTLEVDKITFYLQAREPGLLLEHLAKPGDWVPVGGDLAKFSK